MTSGLRGPYQHKARIDAAQVVAIAAGGSGTVTFGLTFTLNNG